MSTNSLTANKWLASAAKKLEAADISTARLDSLVLLEDITDKDRGWLLAHPEYGLTDQQIRQLNSQIERRSKHEPLAYIRGKSEFYGRTFGVNPHTLEPRPETETMIDLLLDFAKKTMPKIGRVIDIGTGSGCIAITAKLELPNIEVIGTDIDERCVDTARKNADQLKANVTFYKGNLIEPVLSGESMSSAALLANLPYVPARYELNKAAKFEPKQAIFGGEDGLDLYRELFSQIATLNNKPALIFTEALPFQHAELTAIAKTVNYNLVHTDDFIQVFSLEGLPLT